MADSIQWVKHIESYVDSSSSPSQQVASLDAIAALLKNGMLTIEALVRDMEMYLTTTDSVIRARGILLLAELLDSLASKTLDDAVIRSLIGFFTERLADWKALRGALVGCMALMKRKSNIGMVTVNEARAVAQSFIEHLQVQSLGQHDRKLCFELLKCLLDRYPDAVAALGDVVVYGICEAIDGEKDPQCLMITFHIVEVLPRLFPDPVGPLASFAGELFEVLGSYFPIHFTHPKGEEVDVKRDELSRALRLAFASTPLFEPFAIPLLLEKLSSSLPSTKVESLRYLSYCSVTYGADRMAQHAEPLWASLRESIFTSLQPILSLEAQPLDDISVLENQIAAEALLLLEKVVLQNGGPYLSLIVGDEEIKSTINSITSFKDYVDIPMQNKKKLHAVGRILAVSARASIASCNRVFESFFLCLMDALGLSGSSGYSNPEDDYKFPGRLCYGALYLCIELIAACRYLVLGSEEPSSTTVSAEETWCCMLQSFCHSLTEAFCFTLITSADEDTQNAYVHSGVRGLQILATFPGSFVPKSIFESILMRLMSIITLKYDMVFLWKSSLKALVEIGSFVGTRNDSDKASSFEGLVVEQIVSLLSSNDSTMPLSLKLEAISEIGTTSLNFMQTIVQALEKAVFGKLSEALVQGNFESAESTVQLLECFSNKLLPWFDKIGGFEEFPLRFVTNIWDEIGKNTDFGIGLQDKELIDATMTAVKLAVATCSEESQSIIIQKALNVLLSSASFPSKESISGVTPTKLEDSLLNHGLNSFPCRDNWIVSLFASVIIALRPQTHIPDVKVILHVFMTTLLSGHVPAAQALGSIVNKLPLKGKTMEASHRCSLEEALDIIFSNSVWTYDDDGLLKVFSGTIDGNEIGLSGLRLSNLSSRLLQVHSIVGLAWMGKGLLMRGHEKVKDVTMTIFSCLLSNSDIGALSLKQHPLEDSTEQDVLPLMKSAADAFHVLMSDSEACLNRGFHAVIRPLYKQRYFSTMMPILISSVVKSDSSITRSMLYRTFAHIVSETPLSAIVSEAKKLIPMLVDSLSTLSEDISNKKIIYSILLVFSAVLTEKNGQEAVVENAYIIITRLLGLITYPHMMLVRETAIQCLVAMSALPHARIYPMRTQVLLALSKALDDPKRAVRQEAVRCRQAWARIASRSLQF